MAYYPYFNKDKLSFIRKENNNYWLIQLLEFPELTELLINHISKEIFDLCDGKKEINEIISMMSDKYIKIDENVIRNDVGTMLSKFSKLGVIEWKDDNDPYIVVNQKLFENGYKIRFAVENDFKRIYEYIYQNKDNFYKFVDFYNQNYTDLAVRAKIFYRVEDYYLLLDPNNNIDCMIGIQKPDARNIYKDARVTFISNIRDVNKVVFLLSYLKENIKDFSFPKPTKIKMVFECKNENLLKVLSLSNFKFESELSNEIDYDKSIFIYSLLLDK
jgi:hypothetical protein